MAASVRWRIDRRTLAKATVHAAAGEALFEAAEVVLQEANRTVPLEEGTLMRSGGTDVDRAALRASVFYDTPYAARQHEELGWRHDEGRRAKWLEQTLREQSTRIRGHVASRIKAVMH